MFELSSGGLWFLIIIAIAVFEIAALWMVFTKAGRPGWAAIIPIYNTYVLIKVVGRPGWWLILFFIPIVSIIVYCIVQLDLAKVFGKGSGFGIGLILLAFIFMPILGFGGARYQDPDGNQLAA